MEDLLSPVPFDYTPLLRTDLPPPAARWSGFPKYNFVGGHNDAASVPVDDLVAAAARVIGREGRLLATYGLESGSQGHLPLREFVAAKLGRDAAIRCTANDVLITSGSLQGLDLVNQVLVASGDTVIVERATYGGAITRLKQIGAEVVGVDVDAHGLDLQALESTLTDLAQRGVRPKYIYTIPTVQNPTATIMPLERRHALLELARRFHVPIFEDECYSDLVWDGKRPPALYALADDDCVVHIGSFSKSIAPALRVGYLIAGWPLLSRILAVKNDGGTGALEQMILAEYCHEHFDAHVRVLRRNLQGKLDVLVDALRSQFGSAVEFAYPEGGIFLWMQLPPAVDTTRLQQAALAAGISVNPGAEWMTDRAAGSRWIRMCFAHPSEAVIRAGVAGLAEVCRREFGLPDLPAPVHR